MTRISARCASFGAAFSLMIVLFVTAGCGGSSEDLVPAAGQGSTGTLPSAPLTVTFVSPSEGAINIPVNAAVYATFDQVLEGTSLTAETFYLTGSDGTRVDGFVTASGGTATFTHLQPLVANSVYTATITSGVRGQNGLALNSPFSWTFTTGESLNAQAAPAHVPAP